MATFVKTVSIAGISKLPPFPKRIPMGKPRLSRWSFPIEKALLLKSHIGPLTKDTGEVIGFFRSPLGGLNREFHVVEQFAPFDPETLRYYAEVAPAYSASGQNGQNRFLEHFMSLLEPGSSILDLGCGSAIDAAALQERGFDVTAIEASPILAASATEMLGHNVRVMRFDELPEGEAYDAIWASASLIHVPRVALSGIIRIIHAALKPRGIHFATYKSGGTEGRDSVGRYYNYPSATELSHFYTTAAPWECVETQEYVGGGFENGQGPWVAVEARRGSAPIP
jgi:SAM-dependent methyltransferase